MRTQQAAAATRPQKEKLSPLARKNIIIGFILINTVTSSINIITGFLIEAVYGILYSGSSMAIIDKALAGIKGVAYILSVAVPLSLALYYIWPTLMIIFGRTSPGVMKTVRRRALNGPFMLGLIGFTGWAAYAAIYYAALIVRGFPFLTIYTLRFTIDSIFAGLACFVFSYYAAEAITRKYYIGALFPGGRLSGCEGAFALTIRGRLIIYFFTVALFPSLLFFEVILSLMQTYSGKITIPGLAAVTAALAALGLWLTVTVANSYRKPLMLMQAAADRIGRENYDINIPVVSNDEIGGLSEAVNDMAVGLKEKEFIRDTFGRMVDPAVRDHLLGGNAELGGKIIETTILFTDIRSFTTMSESMPPDAVVELLNRYFDLMGPCVSEEKGIVNKYIGDSLMAIFGAPLKLDNHPAAAVRAAIRMSEALKTLNAELALKDLPPVAHGVGIHTGPALVGNIGAGSRMEYTAIGDTVNTASRIQGLCKQYKKEIIISQATQKQLNGQFYAELLGETEIRGRNQPVKIYTIKSIV